MKDPAREAEGLQLYTSVYEIATSVEESDIQAKALSGLTIVLLQAGQMERAEDIARLIAGQKLMHELAMLDLSGKKHCAM